MFTQEIYKYKIGIAALAFVLTFVFSSYNCIENESKAGISASKNETAVRPDSVKIPDGLRKLLKAYPDFLERADENHLYWKDGTVMIYDDGKDKTFEEKLDNADLEDMMTQEYVRGADWDYPPPENFEPGRIRNEAFFLKMYGGTQSEVKGNLVTISWTPSGASLQVSSVNDADKQLKAVADELAAMPEKFQKYFKKTAGTFNYRKIAGTNRTSAHSYGIAIDINTQYSDYWQWNGTMNYKNQIPIEIVEVFEKYGFIWGGKWYHYDTMHFEYRPELIVN
ncbi:MAG: M15 family metallopeptidase [Ignavibacteria bacterium]|nr:M15 family metallopeptidase [Ignavibacteria bacterium]